MTWALVRGGSTLCLRSCGGLSAQASSAHTIQPRKCRTGQHASSTWLPAAIGPAAPARGCIQCGAGRGVELLRHPRHLLDSGVAQPCPDGGLGWRFRRGAPGEYPCACTRKSFSRTIVERCRDSLGFCVVTTVRAQRCLCKCCGRRPVTLCGASRSWKRFGHHLASRPVCGEAESTL